MVNLAVQLVVALFLGTAAILVFRRVAHDYRTRGGLSLPSTLMEIAVFGLHGGVSYLYMDSRLAQIRTASPLFVVAIARMTGGLLFVLLAMSRLGWGESLGRQVSGLRQAGLYRCTRNPQIVAYTFLVVGYALLWPSWSGVVWVGLYLLIVHLMVRTEEDYLRCVYGDEFVRYCRRTPRYIGIPKSR